MRENATQSHGKSSPLTPPALTATKASTNDEETKPIDYPQKLVLHLQTPSIKNNHEQNQKHET